MKRGYILIPDDIAARRDLTAAHKVVLGIIGRLQGMSAAAYPSLKYIADAGGMSRSQIIRIVNDLVAREEVTRLHHPYQTNTYSAKWATARANRTKWAAKKAS